MAQPESKLYDLLEKQLECLNELIVNEQRLRTTVRGYFENGKFIEITRTELPKEVYEFQQYLTNQLATIRNVRDGSLPGGKK